jgi:large subunit ribosomal protein L19
MNLLQTVEAENYTRRLAQGASDLRAGDMVRVHAKILEGDKSRVQVFEGTVIRIHRGSARGTVTVRKVSSNVGVERIFPICSPNVARIEVVMRHKVRRAKLHFLRNRKGKAARLKPMSGSGAAKK